ncbi:unnamed protein product [Hermetia illucens]|uniref:Uncharacterized protein n=1 Tax=Hermetia illucens TaxID=343691 RepID=A0A7R8V737_HERIL|nr:unnamed protein product [Hermetia illucens]
MSSGGALLVRNNSDSSREKGESERPRMAGSYISCPIVAVRLWCGIFFNFPDIYPEIRIYIMCLNAGPPHNRNSVFCYVHLHTVSPCDVYLAVPETFERPSEMSMTQKKGINKLPGTFDLHYNAI